MREGMATRLGKLYDEALVDARTAALIHGYALAVHGSELRDLDLIAVPWHEDATTAEEVAEAIRAAVNGVFSVGTQTGEVMTERPHGRKSWAIHLRNVPALLVDATGRGGRAFAPYIDLSVMPVAAPATEESTDGRHRQAVLTSEPSTDATSRAQHGDDRGADRT